MTVQQRHGSRVSCSRFKLQAGFRGHTKNGTSFFETLYLLSIHTLSTCHVCYSFPVSQILYQILKHIILCRWLSFKLLHQFSSILLFTKITSFCSVCYTDTLFCSVHYTNTLCIVPDSVILANWLPMVDGFYTLEEKLSLQLSLKDTIPKCIKKKTIFTSANNCSSHPLLKKFLFAAGRDSHRNSQAE